MYRFLLLSLALGFSQLINAQTNAPPLSTEEMQECLSSSIMSADEQLTIKELKAACQLLSDQQHLKEGVDTLFTTTVKPDDEDNTQDASNTPKTLHKRMTMEAFNRANRFVLTPNKRNFFLPVSYNDSPNAEPYQGTDESSFFNGLRNTEAELQLSIKILLRENIFGKNGHLYLGYTNHSFWQVYSNTDSAPFRETDHEPELILSFTNDLTIFGFSNSINEIILNHQSNGQGELLSRSWNRIMLNSVFEKGNFVFSVKPWYRIPEQAQAYPGDPDGDDNPDIEHYLGNFEASAAYKYDSNIFSLMLRNNLESDNKGAVELGWSFPITSNLRGQFKYFNGYGNSLIDYNDNQNIFALGIIFTDFF
jgi:phospholipase A1/A2